MQKELEHQSRINADLANRLAMLCTTAETPSTPAVDPDSENDHANATMVPPAMEKAVPRLSQDAATDGFVAMEKAHQVPRLSQDADTDGFIAPGVAPGKPRAQRSVTRFVDDSPQADGVFFDSTEELRKLIRSHLTDKAYNVADYYKEKGICQAIARSHSFEIASLTLVIASSLWMSVDIDYNSSFFLHQADTIFQVVGHLICFLFTAELLVRLLAFKDPRKMVRDFWCMFDLLLVIFIVAETWFLWLVIVASGLEVTDKNIRALGVLRMLRLVRILRLVKVFRFVPELFVIIRGIGIAVRAISLVFLLLGILVYVSAVAFRLLLEATSLGALRFQNVAQAMSTLLLDCALSGTKGGPLMREAYSEHPIYAVLFFCFAVLAGLLVQTIKKIAEVEEEEKRSVKNQNNMDDFWKHMLEMDEDNDGFITHDEFVHLLSDRKTVRLLKKMDVDPESLISLKDFMFKEHMGHLSQKDFNNWVLDMRKTQKGTLKDHYLTRKFMAEQLSQPSMPLAGCPSCNVQTRVHV